jgi:CRISPR-associated protein Cas5t
MLKAIHTRLRGATASFRHPLVITGMQLSTPLPPLSTILGMLSACAGKTVRPTDTRIGFDFRCSGTGTEFERTNRFEYDHGELKPHRKGQGIVRRQVLINPQLDVYLSNTSLIDVLKYPVSTPTMGRSQDLAWVEFAREIELYPRARGKTGPTLLPDSFAAPGLILRLPEWMDNDVLGIPRLAGPFLRFKALLPYDTNYYEVEGRELYHPSDADEYDYIVYMHEWIKE